MAGRVVLCYLANVGEDVALEETTGWAASGDLRCFRGRNAIGIEEMLYGGVERVFLVGRLAVRGSRRRSG